MGGQPRMNPDDDSALIPDTKLLWQLLESSSSFDVDRAFNILFPIVGRAVYFAARKRGVMSLHDRDDFIQEVCIKIFKHFDRFDTSRDLGAWVYAIADRVVLNHLKAQKKTKSISGYESIEALASLAQGAKDAGSSEDADRPGVSRFKEVLYSDQFSDDERRIMMSEGLKAGELAAELDTTSAAIRTRRCRLLKKLHRILSSAGRDA
jgi:RNA polymerase sigma factor (sigma-70 family)